MSSKIPRKSSKASPTSQKQRSSWRRRLLNRVGLVLVAVFVGFTLYVLFTTPRDPAATRRLPDRPGQPWEYDERLDAYYDPRPGHEHWHEGRPPDPENR